MTYRVLDPTSEHEATIRFVAARLASLKGKRVGFISNGKEGTKGFFARLERLLYEELQVESVTTRTKANFSAPAESEILEECSSWDLSVSGVGD